MRLGLYDAILKNNSLISKIYSEKRIKKGTDIDMRLTLNTKMILKRKVSFFSIISRRDTS